MTVTTRERHLDRQAALARVRNALQKGKMVKPERCEQCGQLPTFHRRRKVRGLVAIFLNGYEDWSNPTWVCYKCHDEHIEKPHRGAFPTGPQADVAKKSPPYEKMRHMLVVEGYSYKQIASMYGLASVSSLQETFKKRALRRNDWPIPEIRSKLRSEKQIRRTPSLGAAGLAQDINAFLRESAMTPKQFATEANVDHEWLNCVLRSQFKRITFKLYDRLERTLMRMRREYADYGARNDALRTELLSMMEYTGRGRVVVGQLLGWNPNTLNPFLHGRVFPKERLDALEEKVIVPWRAEVARQNAIRDRLREPFEKVGKNNAWAREISTHREVLLGFLDGGFMHPPTFERMMGILPTWEERYADWRAEAAFKQSVRERVVPLLVNRAQTSERTFAGLGERLGLDSDRVRRFCRGTDVAFDMEMTRRLEAVVSCWEASDEFAALAARATQLAADVRLDLCEDLRRRFLARMGPPSRGRSRSRSTVAMARSGACSLHRAKSFLLGKFTVTDDELHALAVLVEKWEADDGVLA